ncbi:MAG: hypothetical protein QM704_00375 [Anaeromyxobacteraceae bacterium]
MRPGLHLELSHLVSATVRHLEVRPGARIFRLRMRYGKFGGLDKRLAKADAFVSRFDRTRTSGVLLLAHSPDRFRMELRGLAITRKDLACIQKRWWNATGVRCALSDIELVGVSPLDRPAIRNAIAWALKSRRPYFLNEEESVVAAGAFSDIWAARPVAAVPLRESDLRDDLGGP